MSDKNDLFEIGLIAGVVGGLVAGLCLAPQSGKKTRKQVKKTVKDFNKKHKQEIAETKKGFIKSIEVLKYNLEHQFQRLVNSVKNRKLRKAKELEENCADNCIFNSEVN